MGLSEMTNFIIIVLLLVIIILQIIGHKKTDISEIINVLLKNSVKKCNSKFQMGQQNSSNVLELFSEAFKERCLRIERRLIDNLRNSNNRWKVNWKLFKMLE